MNRPQWTAILAERRLEWLWDEAEKARVPVMALITHGMTPLIDELTLGWR